MDKRKGRKMTINKWKIIAMIFIGLFILETIVVIGLVGMGIGLMRDESECSYNICEGYDSYYYDEINNVCYCYLDDGIAHQQYIR